MIPIVPHNKTILVNAIRIEISSPEYCNNVPQ
jgi:hypothetical protein